MLSSSSRRAATTAAAARRHLARHNNRVQNQYHQLRACLSSSINEPTLFPTIISADDIAKSGTNKNLYDDHMLTSDVRTMGALLGDAISLHHGEDVLDKVEKMRMMAKEGRSNNMGGAERLVPLVDFVDKLSAKELVVISRAFAHFLGVANAAEAHQRCRRLKIDIEKEGSEGLLGALHETKRDSTAGVLSQFLNNEQEGGKKVTKDELYNSLINQTVELVLTAHPTQVNRRTLLEKHFRVQSILNEADNIRDTGTPYQRQLLDDALKREIASIWQTDEVSRVKPTPQSEAERGTLVLETVLWEVLPSFLRKLDATMKSTMGEEYGLPFTARPFIFSSWMGGDRDGNPNVTPNVTREVCLVNRIKASTLLEKDVRQLMGLISGNPPRGLDDQCRFKSSAMDKVRERTGQDSRAPFRSYLNPLANKLKKTSEWAKQELQKLQKKNSPDSAGGKEKSTTNITLEEVYLSKGELMEELLTVHSALTETGNGEYQICLVYFRIIDLLVTVLTSCILLQVLWQMEGWPMSFARCQRSDLHLYHLTCGRRVIDTLKLLIALQNI